MEVSVGPEGSYAATLNFFRSGDAVAYRANGDQVYSAYSFELEAYAGGLLSPSLFTLTTVSSDLPDMLFAAARETNASYFESYVNQIYPADPDANRFYDASVFDGSGAANVSAIAALPEGNEGGLLGLGAGALALSIRYGKQRSVTQCGKGRSNRKPAV